MNGENLNVDDFIGEAFNKISHKNLSLFAFIWTMYIARLSTGGKEGNFYKVDMGNTYYSVELKVTIKKEISDDEKEAFKHIFDFDIDEAIKQFQEAGLIEKELEE